MIKYWTCHWQFKYWTPSHNEEGKAIVASGSNLFLDRGVRTNDLVYVISMSRGLLYLGGRMTVRELITRDAAVSRLGNDRLYEGADEWILGDKSGGTLLRLNRRLSADVSAKIQFLSPLGVKKAPFFKQPGVLDNQATRGVRQFTKPTGELFERIIRLTDDAKRFSAPATIEWSDLEGDAA